MTVDQFVAELGRVSPETEQLVTAHHAEYGDTVVLHLLVADVRRLAIATFETSRAELLTRCLDLLASGLSGDDAVSNAVSVSFVEDSQWWDPRMSPFIKTWPKELQDEATRQKRASKSQ